MNIKCKLILSLISEALSTQINQFENKLMNQNFKDDVEKQLLCFKLKRSHRLQQHIQSAILSEKVNETVVIE